MKLEDLKLGDLSDMEYRYMLSEKYNASEEIFLSWDRILEVSRELPIEKRTELYALIQHVTSSAIALTEKAHGKVRAKDEDNTSSFENAENIKGLYDA